MTLRPRHTPSRPSDDPIFTNASGMDFEKRRLIVPPSFIKLAVLKGGDDYVTAEDLATIVNAFVEEMEKLRREMAMTRLHLESITGENITEEDVVR